MLFSEPKIPQSAKDYVALVDSPRFSALQRAENSSNPRVPTEMRSPVGFQCSSASRKFLKRYGDWANGDYDMFQCSSASRKFLKSSMRMIPLAVFTFQCSSASRKFLKISAFVLAFVHPEGFSALQRAENSSNSRRSRRSWVGRGFSALQRAENSSKCVPRCEDRSRSAFQCSSASRKFLKPTTLTFQSQPVEFQCSSASRKFLKSDRQCA